MRKDLENHEEKTRKAFNKVDDDIRNIKNNVEKLILLLQNEILTDKQKQKVISEKTVYDELERIYWNL